MLPVASEAEVIVSAFLAPMPPFYSISEGPRLREDNVDLASFRRNLFAKGGSPWKPQTNAILRHMSSKPKDSGHNYTPRIPRACDHPQEVTLGFRKSL